MDTKEFLPACPVPFSVGQAPINTANGIVLRDKMKMEMKIVSVAGQELTPWFIEDAIVQPVVSGSLRLSGNAMRQYLFFATPKGNDRLYVSQRKAGLIRDIPAYSINIIINTPPSR